MQYRKDKYGKELSALGYGCMRFTQKGGKIDIDKAEGEVLRAIELGVNYFDTAYIYQGSEAALGEIISRNKVREKIYIATKLPQYLISNSRAIDKYFNEQKSRLKTDYIDYYLMHMLTDIEAWNKLVGLGIKDWIEAKKKSGEIRNIGFSFHGDTEMFLKILEAYDWDFCQIQYNYLDEVSQAGRRGLETAEAKGIPVIIMEPLRGGRLVEMLPTEAKKQIAEHSRGYSAAEWAFRWLYDQKGVTVVLSGMNSIPMVEENCAIADSCPPGSLTQEDHGFIAGIKAMINEKTKVGCTGCRYCMPCPKNVDIPSIFSCYNHIYTESRKGARREYMQTVALRKKPADADRCVECGKCEQHCPQHIEIRKKLKEADRELRPWYLRIFYAVARKVTMSGGRGSR